MIFKSGREFTDIMYFENSRHFARYLLLLSGPTKLGVLLVKFLIYFNYIVVDIFDMIENTWIYKACAAK